MSSVVDNHHGGGGVPTHGAEENGRTTSPQAQQTRGLVGVHVLLPATPLPPASLPVGLVPRTNDLLNCHGVLWEDKLGTNRH